ncbi:MAG: alpha-galactosidase [Candidatus Hydrogenedentes bacterium]|nr:alpha-galactosidase [Candidatus Hydrogenedentota bacterium]
MLAAMFIAVTSDAQFFFRNKDARGTSAGSYEVTLLNSGQANVQHSSRNPIFENARPMIWFDGEVAPAPLPVSGNVSKRNDISDALGKGQGLTIERGECVWSLRIYPAEPFFCAQVAYTNQTKEPVRVRMLSPWTAGDGKRGGFTLGDGTATCTVLEGGKTFPGDTGIAGLRTGPGECLWNLAALNSKTDRNLVAGFLAYTTGYGKLRITPPSGKGRDHWFSEFAAECVYDPPVTVQPGQQLVSEPLYLGVSEENVLEGLERYGWALASANNINREQMSFLPHGWDSWSTEYRNDISEAKVIENLEFLSTNLARYGWNTMAIDDGWQVALGDWDPSPERFPNGMKPVADAIHAKQMTASLWVAPFRVNVESALAKAHPEWLRAPNELGKQVVGEKDRILDVTAPGAYEWVRDLAKKVTQDWGFDAIMEADFAYYLPLAESYHDSTLTRVEVYRKGMQALREGMGNDKFLMGLAPHPITGMYAQGMRLGNDCAPIWRKTPDKWPWGAVESLSNAARKYYYAPWVWRADQDCVFFAHEETRNRWEVAEQPALTHDESIAWLTGAALTGGIVKIGDRFSALAPNEIAALQKVLPVLDRPARPVDLFREENPRIWVLPVKAAFGEWTIVGVFNWSDQEQVNTLDFRELGLASNAYYTVYGFWEDKYYGTAEKQVQVAVPPRGVRLLSFRQYEGRPMLLATSRHFSGGATDFTALHWHDDERRLDAAFNGVANTVYKLRVFVPEGFDEPTVKVSCGEATTAMEGRVLAIEFTCAEAVPVEWSVAFK